MASRQLQAAPFKAEDIRLFRARKMHEYGSTKVFHKVFRKGTERRQHSMSLFDFYQNKGIKINKFKKSLNTEQIQKIDNDPDGDTFDITLLFQCIQWGCDGVANKNDDKWKEGNESLESLLTTVKNKRNSVSHEVPQYTKQQFMEQTEEIRLLLTKILRFAETRYNIPTAEVDQWIKDMNADINLIRDRSLIPLVYDDYKKQNLFLEKGTKVRGEGKLSLNNIYDGWDSISPASLILNLEFKVKSIFTEMVLLKESDRGVETKQELKDLLANINYCVDDPVILIEGIAGVGKTTLTKKILSDWVSGQSIVSSLISYDLLLHAECRNRSIKSFKELIRSLMPELARSFQDDDFSHVVLDQKIILLVDGLDEFNSSSSSLFNEVLELKKTNGLTIIATTRPEKVETYYQIVDSLHIRTKHIKLIGIPKKEINQFVSKYVSEMEVQSSSTPDINILLDYLKKTALQLSDLWMLPYNLILLIIFWTDDPSAVYSITTAPELYWIIHHMIRRKLIGRLLFNDATKHLGATVLAERIDVFISSLGKEALVGLKNDEINLPEEANQRLTDTCAKENIPPEEMTGAFLKTVVMRTSLGMDKRYSFPHKGSQEFQGALNMFNDIARKCHGIDVTKAEAQVKMYLDLPENLKEKIIRLIKEESGKDSQSAATASTSAQTSPPNTTSVMDMLTSLHGSAPLDITKYQNLFIILIGMFYLETHHIEESTKMEVLKLLKETGIKNQSDWVRILNSVKCDKFVATFISQQPGVLEGEIKIEDFNLFAYTSLLKTMKLPLQSTGKVSFDLDIKGDGSGLEDLLRLISNHQFKVNKISITDKNYAEYHSVLKSLPLPLKDAQEVNIDIVINEETSDMRELLELIHKNQYNVNALDICCDFRRLKTNLVHVKGIKHSLRRCKVREYRGTLLQGMKIPKTMRKLRVSLPNANSYFQLQVFLQSEGQQLEVLDVSVNHQLDSSIMGSLGNMKYIPSLWIPGITKSSEIKNAANIAKSFLPSVEINQKYYLISFPKLRKNKIIAERVIEEFKEVKVHKAVCFPSYALPRYDEIDAMENLAKSTLGCRYITWKDEDEIWFNPFDAAKDKDEYDDDDDYDEIADYDYDDFDATDNDEDHDEYGYDDYEFDAEDDENEYDDYEFDAEEDENEYDYDDY